MQHSTQLFIYKLIAVWFGAGANPKAPGTYGSAAAILCALPVLWLDNASVILLIMSALVTLIGWWATRGYIAHYCQPASDPKEVVVDEVAGQWLTLSALPALSPLPIWLQIIYICAAFILFRVFDIIKPFPVSWADKHIKNAWGVMFDDILAALYAIFYLLLLQWFIVDILGVTHG